VPSQASDSSDKGDATPPSGDANIIPPATPLRQSEAGREEPSDDTPSGDNHDTSSGDSATSCDDAKAGDESIAGDGSEAGDNATTGDASTSDSNQQVCEGCMVCNKNSGDGRLVYRQCMPLEQVLAAPFLHFDRTCSPHSHLPWALHTPAHCITPLAPLYVTCCGKALTSHTMPPPPSSDQQVPPQASTDSAPQQQSFRTYVIPARRDKVCVRGVRGGDTLAAAALSLAVYAVAGVDVPLACCGCTAGHIGCLLTMHHPSFLAPCCCCCHTQAYWKNMLSHWWFSSGRPGSSAAAAVLALLASDIPIVDSGLKAMAATMSWEKLEKMAALRFYGPQDDQTPGLTAAAGAGDAAAGSGDAAGDCNPEEVSGGWGRGEGAAGVVRVCVWGGGVITKV
jgi:hypothetical protein